jgi:hypothetical protein
MSGHFTFEYLEGPNKGEEFDCQINEFLLRLPDNQFLINTPESDLD